MIVVNKNNNEECRVYDISYDKKGYPHFLIYKNGQWLRLSAKYFKPYEPLEDFLDRIKPFNRYKMED